MAATTIPKQYSIGIDVGGTKMLAVLYDGEKVIVDDTLGTPTDNLEHFLVMLQAVISPLLDKAKELKVKVQGIGLGVAGVIDYGQGKMLKSPNIPNINGAKLPDLITARIGLPIVIDNDAKCFVRAEVLKGAALKQDNVIGIIIGTGIGCGWWYNGKVYHGAHGGAGEPGNMIIEMENEIGLEEAYHKLTQNNPKNLAVEAYRGDMLAQKTYDELGKLLGIGMANIVNLIDPESIVIGGGVVESSDLFLTAARKMMQKHIESELARKKVKIVKSKLGNVAGAIGAALLIN
jgi:glucokinase